MSFPTITVSESKGNPGPLQDVVALRAMYQAGYHCVEQAADHPIAENRRFWFGSAGANNAAGIDASATKLRDYMNGGMTKLNFICTGLAGSMMSFNQYEPLRVPGRPEVDKLGKSTNVMCNLGFSMSRFSYGERVGAILHEITHMCIGTADVKLDDREIYGADYCQSLGVSDTNLAVTNADNWCYYLTSYHDLIAERLQDWGFLTPSGVAARRRAG